VSGFFSSLSGLFMARLWVPAWLMVSISACPCTTGGPSCLKALIRSPYSFWVSYTAVARLTGGKCEINMVIT